MKFLLFFLIIFTLTFLALLYLEWIEITPQGYAAYETLKTFLNDSMIKLGDLLIDLYTKLEKIL